VNVELTMTLVYDDIPPIQRKGAVATLRAANHALKLMRECERVLTGKPPRIAWDINIYSLRDRVVFEFGAINATAELSSAIAERVLAVIRLLGGPE
jgi:hypothetical protein